MSLDDDKKTATYFEKYEDIMEIGIGELEQGNRLNKKEKK